MARIFKVTTQWGRGVAWSSIGASGGPFFKKSVCGKGASLRNFARFQETGSKKAPDLSSNTLLMQALSAALKISAAPFN